MLEEWEKRLEDESGVGYREQSGDFGSSGGKGRCF